MSFDVFRTIRFFMKSKTYTWRSVTFDDFTKASPLVFLHVSMRLMIPNCKKPVHFAILAKYKKGTLLQEYCSFT